MPGLRESIRTMAGYVPGEQPKEGEIIKLNTNENPYPPSPRVFEAIKSVLTGNRLRRYPEPLGNTFRQAAGRVLNVDPDSIIIGNGSDDILTILTRAFVPEKGVIASLTPSYILYKSLAEIQGSEFRTVPYAAGWQLPDAPLLREANLTFIANPNSPSGTIIDPAKVAELARESVGQVVLDEAYVDFTDRNGLPYIETSNLIVSRTFSKSYALAGIRFGFGVAKPSTIRELLKVKDSYNCDVLSLTAATAAIEDQDYLIETRNKIIATRERLTQSLRQLGFEVESSEANFVWARRHDRALKPLYEGLKARHILVRYMSYEGYGDGLRVSVGTDEEIDLFLNELTQLLNQ
jgi:histidinol-phosphate aminotransferase